MESSFPCGSAGKESTRNAGDLGSIPGLGRSPGEANSYPLSVFWPGKFHGLYSPWGCKELDSTEQPHKITKREFLGDDKNKVIESLYNQISFDISYKHI